MQKPVVVVPNWNGIDGLKACLDSLQSQSLPAHVIVVDNGSDDGTARTLADGIVVESSAEPLSFAAAVNRGIARARFSYVCNGSDEQITRSFICQFQFHLFE